jgi:hypothetical protein
MVVVISPAALVSNPDVRAVFAARLLARPPDYALDNGTFLYVAIGLALSPKP